MALFLGLMRAHGAHGKEERSDAKDKVEIKKSARTIHEQVTDKLWQDHIDGEKAVGIVPINENSECNFAAIDIDDYTVDHLALVRAIEPIVPAVVCRSKSGGAHVFVFFQQPLPAELVVRRLRQIAAKLGYPSVEIFPKQTHLTEEGDGNWINMPYFGGDSSRRVAVKPNGLGMALKEFLMYAEARRMTKEQFTKVSLEDARFSDGPPCLELLSTRKIHAGEGVRNGIFNLGILARKMRPDDWEELLRQWNTEICSPPIKDEELQSVIRSLRKKEYNYKCREVPIVSVCSREICILRKHGISGNVGANDIASLTVVDTEPKLYYAEMRQGGRVECSARELLDPTMFAVAALSQCGLVLPIYKRPEWNAHVEELMKTAEHTTTSEDVGITGYFLNLLKKFCTERSYSDTIDGLHTHKPWYDEENRRIWFILSDVMELMNMYRFKELDRNKIPDRIASIGGGSQQLEYKGAPINAFWVPITYFSRRQEPISTPQREDVPI